MQPGTGSSDGDTRRDGSMDVRIVNNGLAARATFRPAAAGGFPLTRHTVGQALAQAGVVNGIDWRRIEETIHRCNDSLQVYADVPVAEGAAPHDEVPEHFELDESLIEGGQAVTKEAHRPATLGASDQVDHRARHGYVVVQKDQPLGRFIPLKPGEMGFGVTGDGIPYQTAAVSTYELGENVARRGSQVVAERAGRLVVTASDVRVDDTLRVDGDVDYHVGDIDFPGAVIIKGEVHAGFRIRAIGSIRVAGPVDAYRIFARGDIEAKGGIIGHDGGTARACGRVRTRFVESVTLESRSSIYVERFILNSDVRSLDRIAMGERGRIVGGEVVATRGVSCANLGNPVERPGIVRVGTDFLAERRLKELEGERDRIMEQLTRITMAISHEERHRRDTGRLVRRRSKLLEMLNRLDLRLQTALGEIDRDEDAEVVVHGSAFPGVTIVICRASLVTDRVSAKVRFFLDRSAGIIRSKPITEAT